MREASSFARDIVMRLKIQKVECTYQYNSRVPLVHEVQSPLRAARTRAGLLHVLRSGRTAHTAHICAIVAKRKLTSKECAQPRAADPPLSGPTLSPVKDAHVSRLITMAGQLLIRPRLWKYSISIKPMAMEVGTESEGKSPDPPTPSSHAESKQSRQFL